MTSRVIAIDGPSASGKSSVAKTIAEKLNLIYISTGEMYRAVAWAVAQEFAGESSPTQQQVAQVLEKLQLEYQFDQSSGKYLLTLNGAILGDKLRNSEIATLTSHIATLALVRSWLRDKQRELAALGWVIMEGRDIGTEVFPDAAMKFYLTASAQERARRRLAQEGAAAGSSLDEVTAAIQKRDYLDSTREISPLKKADDAVVIDSTDFEFEQTIEQFLSKICRHHSTYRVPYADTDQMGVVYYANYLEYFERSRTEMLRSVGMAYKDLEHCGFFLPVSEVNCQYKGSARYDDLLTFRSWVLVAKGARLVIRTEVCRDSEVLAVGDVTLGCVDSNRRLMRLPKELISACAIFQGD